MFLFIFPPGFGW